MLVSAVLNVRLRDATMPIKWLENGGYFSWPLIWLLEKGLKNGDGSYITAIKAIVIVFLIVLIGYLLYVFNVRLPKLPKISIEESPKPRENKKTDSKEQERPTITISRPEISTADIMEKVSQATGKISKATSGGGSLLKDMLKSKVEQKIEEKKPKPVIHYSGDKPTFGTSLLESGLGQEQTIDENFLVEKAKALQTKLGEFGVPIAIEGFDIGPSIVQIKIKPDEGIRISAIEGLANDIKLSLKSKSLRIIAPIPGTDLVGIQIPNPKPNMVRLGDVINTSEFSEGMKKNLTNLSLGKGIDGSVQIRPLEKMPHLLVAGATGSGKSVGINDFIVSLMFQNTPAELKFLMVDPKQVELEMYSGLPYLLAPIVYDSGKAIKLLQRTVEEMEKRYTTLKDQRVRNLDEYNEKWKSKVKKRCIVLSLLLMKWQI